MPTERCAVGVVSTRCSPNPTLFTQSYSLGCGEYRIWNSCTPHGEIKAIYGITTNPWSGNTVRDGHEAMHLHKYYGAMTQTSFRSRRTGRSCYYCCRLGATLLPIAGSSIAMGRRKPDTGCGRHQRMMRIHENIHILSAAAESWRHGVVVGRYCCCPRVHPKKEQGGMTTKNSLLEVHWNEQVTSERQCEHALGV